jgi:hypothetical protein
MSATNVFYQSNESIPASTPLMAPLERGCSGQAGGVLRRGADQGGAFLVTLDYCALGALGYNCGVSFVVRHRLCPPVDFLPFRLSVTVTAILFLNNVKTS